MCSELSTSLIFRVHWFSDIFTWKRKFSNIPQLLKILEFIGNPFNLFIFANIGFWKIPGYFSANFSPKRQLNTCKSLMHSWRYNRDSAFVPNCAISSFWLVETSGFWLVVWFQSSSIWTWSSSSEFFFRNFRHRLSRKCHQ